MERKIATLDILGFDVDLLITDDADKLSDELGDPKFGIVQVKSCQIYLDASIAPSYMRCVLQHEVKEFAMLHLDAQYDNSHDFFEAYDLLEWTVFKANADILYGNKLAELILQK